MSSSVKSGRPDRSFAHRLTDPESLVQLPGPQLVNPNSRDEASVVQPSLSGPTEKKIRKLYSEGVSMVRIRQRLGLKIAVSRIRAASTGPLEAALTATRRDDLQHGTNAAYVRGCVCKECREYQRRRMDRNS